MGSDKVNYDTIPTVEAVPVTTMVEVIAPETLQEGYIFDAKYEGVTFPVVVPPGGVTQGERLVVPFDPKTAKVWKDDLFACTRYGIFHPSCLCALCCRFILLGQIMTRLQLDWCAQPSTPEKYTKTFRTMVWITIIFLLVNLIFSPANPDDQPNPIYNINAFVASILMLMLLTRVRRIVRERNQIPEQRCIGCEDLCCAFWCGCCTASQLARQTADYDNEEARFFSNDGLQPQTPVMVV